MSKSSQNSRHNQAKHCAFCDGKFGLVRYYSWRIPLCSKKCVNRFKARRADDHNWLRRLLTA